jgi:hypothetical protein
MGILLLLNMDVSSAQTPNNLNAFFGRSKEECVRDQRAAPENAKVSAAGINQYCDCVMRNMKRVVTTNELEEMSRTGMNPQSLQGKLNAAGASCAVEMENFVENLIQAAKSECVKKIDPRQLFTAAKVDEYCGCIMRHMVEVMTPGDMLEILKADKPPQSLQKMMNTVEASCKKTILDR